MKKKLPHMKGMTPAQCRVAKLLTEPLWPHGIGKINPKAKASLRRQPDFSGQQPCCKSCGTPWIGHLGCQGTCAALQCALKTLRDIGGQPRHRHSGIYARSCVSFIESQMDEAKKAGRNLERKFK